VLRWVRPCAGCPVECTACGPQVVPSGWPLLSGMTCRRSTSVASREESSAPAPRRLFRIMLPTSRAYWGVTSPADAIPDLERLMRDVLRGVFAATLGAEWLNGLSNQVRKGVERAAETAHIQRPDETLRDDWDAVGIGEIAATLRSTWQNLNNAVADVWPTLDEATVDLNRLSAYRGKNLHAVGPPEGQIKDEEIAAMILRLRIGFEGLRRSLAHDDDEWWPYIEAIHSNIPEFCFDRTTPPPLRRTVLTEGDLVWFEIVGVHPQGRQDRLRYRLTGGYPFAEAFPGSGWVEHSEFRVSVPKKRDVQLFLSVADVDDLDNVDMQSFQCRVRPR
jgi:hypothetical protein